MFQDICSLLALAVFLVAGLYGGAIVAILIQAGRIAQ